MSYPAEGNIYCKAIESKHSGVVGELLDLAHPRHTTVCKDLNVKHPELNVVVPRGK